MARKKVPYLDDKYRKDFIGSMAKKLAVGGNEILAVPKKPSLILFILPGLLAIGVGITTYFLFVPPKMEVYAGEKIMPLVAVNPAEMLSQSYQKCELSMDEYAGYLCGILVQYDSLPEKFRPKVPLIKPDEVIDTLKRIYPQLKAQTKSMLLEQFPDINGTENLDSNQSGM